MPIFRRSCTSFLRDSTRWLINASRCSQSAARAGLAWDRCRLISNQLTQAVAAIAAATMTLRFNVFTTSVSSRLDIRTSNSRCREFAITNRRRNVGQVPISRLPGQVRTGTHSFDQSVARSETDPLPTRARQTFRAAPAARQSAASSRPSRAKVASAAARHGTRAGPSHISRRQFRFL